MKSAEFMLLITAIDELDHHCQWPTELSHFRPLILSHFSREKITYLALISVDNFPLPT